MKNPFIRGVTLTLFAIGCIGMLTAITTRPQYAIKDAFVVTCLVGVTSFPTVDAKMLVIRVLSTETNPVWIGPDGGTAVGDGLEIESGLLSPIEVPVSTNANEMDCIRDGAADVDLTVIVYR